MKKERVVIRPYLTGERQALLFYTIADEAFDYGAPWTLKQYEETLSRPDLFFYVAQVNRQIIGYIGGKTVFEEAEIYTIVVQKEYQNQKIAKELLDKFIEFCRKNNVEHLFLEVRVSNKIARRFYEKNAFSVLSIRKNYYKNPTEDAIVMASRFRKKVEDDQEENTGN